MYTNASELALLICLLYALSVVQAAAMEKFRSTASASNPFAAAAAAAAPEPVKEETPNNLDLFGKSSPVELGVCRFPV